MIFEEFETYFEVLEREIFHEVLRCILVDFVVAQINDTKLIWTGALTSDETNSLGMEKFY